MSTYRELFSDLVGKAKETLEKGGVKEVYDRGLSRTKSYARLAKLTLDMNSESEELKKVYTEIGKLFCEQNPAAPDEIYAALFAQLEEHRASLRAKQAEIDAMKAEFEAQQAERSGDIEVEIGDFDDIVSATELEGKGE